MRRAQAAVECCFGSTASPLLRGQAAVEMLAYAAFFFAVFVAAVAVFLQVQAPYGPLAPHAVTEVMYRACRRAGLTPTGPHRLRHSAATSMRRAGAPLFEIGQILRHGQTTSTALYAKEDLGALGRITQPWPGAEQ